MLADGAPASRYTRWLGRRASPRCGGLYRPTERSSPDWLALINGDKWPNMTGHSGSWSPEKARRYG